MKYFFIFKGELRRTIEEAKNYRLQTISNVVSTAIFFLGFSFAVPPDMRGSNLFLLISMLLWYFSLEIINQMSHYILEEKYFGTIEKIFLSPFGPVIVLSFRALSSLILSSGIVIVMFFGLSLAIGISPFAITLPMLATCLVTLAGLYGFGLMLAGLTIINSRTSSISSIVTYILLFISGMLIPLQEFPPILGAIARFFPLTNGIEMLRTITSENLDVISVLLHPNSIFGIAYSVLSIVAGFVIFRSAVRRAKTKGIIRSI